MNKVRASGCEQGLRSLPRMGFLYVLVIMTMFFSASIVKAQYVLPVNFEDPAINFLTDFGGNESTFVADPESAMNMVVRTTKLATAELWAGTTLGPNNRSFDGVLPFAPGSTTLTARVWSPIAGATVRMKVEVFGRSDLSAETDAVTTAEGEWETLSFDFSQTVTGTQPLNFDFEYNMLSMFFNFGIPGAQSGELVFYWDDVAFADGSLLRDPGDPGDPGDPPVRVSLPVTFEQELDWDNLFTNFDGGAASVVSNPDPSGMNISDFVGRMVKGPGQIWGGAYFDLDNKINMMETPAFKIQVWSPRAGSMLLFKLENSMNPSENVEINEVVGVGNAWTQLTYDFSNHNISNNFDRIVLIFDLGESGDGSENFTYYFDNIDAIVPITNREITFQVDMTYQVEARGFDPETMTVHALGGYLPNGWDLNPSNVLSRVGTSLLYNGTFSFAEGPGALMYYKFRVNSPTSYFSEGWETIANRELYFGPYGVDVVLDPVYFDNFTFSNQSRDVVFNVDMSVQSASGRFDYDAGDRVYLVSSFLGWDYVQEGLMQAIPETEHQYTLRYTISADEGSELQYKFRIFSGEGRDAGNMGYELIGTDPFQNRILVVGPPDADQVLPMAFFDDDDGSTGPGFTIRDLYAYETINTLGDISANPMIGQEVTFTAVVTGRPLNSALAGASAMGPARVHFFVTDINALFLGREGMSMQIVDTDWQRAISVETGDVVTITGTLTYFMFTAQFVPTAAYVVHGNVLQSDSEFSMYAPLLDPVEIHLAELNYVPDGNGQTSAILSAYPQYNYSYVTVSGATVIHSDNGFARPRLGLAKHDVPLYTTDISHRFRNDREGQYPVGFNHRAPSEGDFYVAPDVGSNVNISGFLTLSNFNIAGYIRPDEVAFAIAPWHDGKVRDATGVLFAPEGYPNDLVVLSSEEPVFRPVTFTVNMSVQQEMGRFNPAFGDQVFLRGSFNGWSLTEDYQLRQRANDPMTYALTTYIEGEAGSEIEYKFFILPGSGDDGSGWERNFDDGRNGNRYAVLGQADVPQNLGTVYFDDQSRVPDDEQDAIPFAIRVDNTMPYVPGQSVEMYLVLGNEEHPYFNMLGFGFQLYYDTDALQLEAYELLESFVTGAEEEDILFFEDYSQPDFDSFSFSRIAQIGGVSGYGPVMKFYFTILEGYEYSGAYVFPTGEEILNTSGERIPTYVEGAYFEIIQNPVWPGDTNNDGIVDILDVLPLGVYFGETGSDRWDRSLSFTPKAGGWFDVMEAMYADATGDGVVNQNDLLPIGYNFGQFVPWKLNSGEDMFNKANTAPLASIELPEGVSGDKHFVTIRFNQPNFILGVATEMTMNALLMSTSTRVESAPLNRTGVLRMERKATETNPLHSFAVTRTQQMGPADVAGTVMTFEITYREDVPAGTKLDVRKLAVTTATSTSTPEFELLASWTTSVSSDQLPTVFELNQNYPNPFNPTTAIRFALPEASAVRLSVYNMLGQQVAVISNGEMSAGWHTVNFDASALSSGMYIYRLEAGNFVQTRKMTLLK
jgi:hypothetical protein